MKKLIIFLLFFNIMSSQNLVTREIFGSRNAKGWNTFIGGVSSTISTPAQLATKLGISNNRIRNFVVVGSDIKCKIIGSYVMMADVFNSADGRFPNVLTYYYDNDSLVTATTYYTFYGQSNFYDFKLNGLAVTYQRDFEGTSCVKYLLPNMTTNNLQRLFRYCYSGRVFYIPRCTKLGNTVGYDNIFDSINSAAIIYCHPSLATCNGGNPDGDIAYAISQGATVRYVTNFTPPNPVTSLATGAITTTSIQFNFTAPTGSANAYDFSEIYKKDVNGNWLYVSDIVSGGIVSGLTTGTTYDFKIVARDIYYNGAESLISATTL